MSDETTKTVVPTLTLNPAEEAQQSPILQMPEAPAFPAQTEDAKKDAAQNDLPAPEAGEVIDESNFTEEEKKQIADFSEQINVQDSNMILQYGVAAQQKLADFSEKALENVQTQDLGKVGDMLSGVVAELKDFHADDEKKGILGFFKKGGNKLEALKAKYDKTEANVDKICNALEEHQVRLLKDTATLDQMYELNRTYFKELSMYILAGKKKLEKVRGTDLAELTKKAQESNLPEDAQAAKDLNSFCDRFEKKLHDLELSRMISLQTAPQLRLIQNNNTMMVEKIQSTLVNTIPLWKNQMVIALGLEHASEAAKAQNAVSEMTNELLKKNADALHTATVATAKESERGIVDIETLQQTNAQLVQTLDEVLQIQADGRQKRLAAEAEMVKMEGELKQKLLEIRKS